MEKQITAAALVLSVAGIGYLKAQQMERMAERAVLDAEAAVVAEAQAAENADARAVCTLSCRTTATQQTSDMDIVLDGADSYDAERDSLTFAWVQTKALTSNCERKSLAVRRSRRRRANTRSN